MKKAIDRREFLRSSAAIGAALYLSPEAFAEGGGKSDDINVALLGAGAQGQVLMDAIFKMGRNSGIRFKAVCDIWEAYNQKRVSGILRAYKHEHNTYVDYREMLDKEKDLDAVIVATPDFWHTEHAVACLKAGLHVYCEKEMSNTLEGARKIVEAARQTGKLVQIGHQRRSNPRYIFCYEKVIKEAKLLNRITTINGQWNRSRNACEDQGWGGDRFEIDRTTLEKYGFRSMQQFRNWRWYRGLGGGPIVDLGSHQIDIYNWFLDTQPKSVIASGGTDYWKGRDWYDSVMAVYEYETKEGTVRAFYQTLTTNSSQGYFETFMGDEGTLVISESAGRGGVYRESWVDDAKWAAWVKKGCLKQQAGTEQPAAGGGVTDVRSTVPAAKYDLPVTMDKPYHQPHLENFFGAIRDRAKLNCPAEVGYETAVTVLKVNEAVEAGRRLEFKPQEFKV
ncbi:MAG TPA: Gfo/Idh/MocA family oxidoreductase [Sedimentisphaerales bacterium]|nr:Gfo/Idh/MocA family oxidoreductase [Sedimentisphaerales bacterium]